MARVEITENVQTSRGSGVSGASVQITDALTGSAVTVYASRTGSTTVVNPVTTDSSGRIEGWLPTGSYNLAVTGSGISPYTQPYEAISGSPAITTDTDAATVTFDLATDKHKVTLGGNRTLAVTNGVDGQQFTLILKQDGTGGRTVTWWSGIAWPGGTVPTLTATSGQADVFTFLRIASGSYYGFVVGQGL